MKKKLTIKEMKQAIEDHYSGIPEMQISVGIYIHHIGNKYIHVLNTWGITSISKETIEDFYNTMLGE